jgi:uncharacterized CHY-type Zn-finger protein
MVAVKQRPAILGVNLDEQTRCEHYRQSEDIIAIKMKCCGEYYACKECHDAIANHPSAVWSRAEWDQLAVICGACASQITVQQYLECKSQCPECKAKFNPGCHNHHHHYFEA